MIDNQFTTWTKRKAKVALGRKISLMGITTIIKIKTTDMTSLGFRKIRTLRITALTTKMNKITSMEEDSRMHSKMLSVSDKKTKCWQWKRNS